MSTLDPAVAATLARALALPPPAPETTRFPQAQFPGLRVSLTPAVDDTQARLLAEVFAAVQWPTQIPLPHQLTPAQREVALAANPPEDAADPRLEGLVAARARALEEDAARGGRKIAQRAHEAGRQGRRQGSSRGSLPHGVSLSMRVTRIPLQPASFSWAMVR